MAKVTQMNKAKVLQGVVDDGTKEIPIVNRFGKLICSIYIRPADFSIVDRYNDFVKDFEKIVDPLKEVSIKNDGTATFEDDWTVIKQVEAEVMHRFDALFDMEEAKDIFAKRNAFSSVGGEFFCLKVLTALGDVITSAVDEENELSKKRTDKYLKDLELEKPEGKTDAGETTDNA
ncbi:MAG: hypothetical protein PHS82_03040 [Lachnospiraceae bacterium]|nr:hypothetical protein [Lachnospiraceae bacterium]